MMKPYEGMMIFMWKRHPSVAKPISSYTKTFHPAIVKGFIDGQPVLFADSTIKRKALRWGYVDVTDKYISFFEDSKLSASEKSLLSSLEGKSLGKSELVELTGLSDSKVKSSLKSLSDKGLISKEGFGKSTVYKKV